MKNTKTHGLLCHDAGDTRLRGVGGLHGWLLTRGFGGGGSCGGLHLCFRLLSYRGREISLGSEAISVGSAVQDIAVRWLSVW